MDPSADGDSLKSLKNAAYIVIEGDAPDQFVHLTPSGAEASRLARPA
jgi:hypothetical protein